MVSQHILKEVQKLAYTPSIDQTALQVFFTRLSLNTNYTRGDNPSDHFCAMYLPIDMNSRSVYSMYHKKTNEWVFPGGHVDEGEPPVDTVKRKCYEQVGYLMKEEKITLFDLCKIEIHDSLRSCKFHYDLWYWFAVHKETFSVENIEQKNGMWVPLTELQTKTNRPEYKAVFKRLLDSE